MEKKRLVMTISAAALLGVLAVGGTLAYLTDTDTKTNKFTIADKVDIDLTEPDWPGDPDDPDDSVPAVPNAIIAKNPKVTNNEAENVVVFIEVRSPLATIKPDVDADASKQELFCYGKLADGEKPKLTATAFDTTWVQLGDPTADGDYNVYLFGYPTVLAENESTSTIFDYVQLKNYVSSDTNPDAADIVVTAYAIQADSLYDADGAVIDTSSEMSKAVLQKIYDIYKDDTTPAAP